MGSNHVESDDKILDICKANDLSKIISATVDSEFSLGNKFWYVNGKRNEKEYWPIKCKTALKEQMPLRKGLELTI